MAGEGTAALGTPVIAGTMVNPRGFGKKVSVGAVGGAIGALAATAVASRSSRASDAPAFGRVAYLAATETEVGLIKAKSGALKMKVTDEALARAPRAELQAVELKDGKLISYMRLQFANGTVWEFDVPKIGKKNAKELVFALGGSVT
jgi:hypothetical protein